MDSRRRPRLIEILTFDGCPHEDAAVEAVGAAVAAARVEEAHVLVSRVGSPEEAVERRFLGSPTVRVDGRDVEPGAGERNDFVLACRLYRTDAGPAGVPDVRWIVAALESPSPRRASE